MVNVFVKWPKCWLNSQGTSGIVMVLVKLSRCSNGQCIHRMVNVFVKWSRCWSYGQGIGGMVKVLVVVVLPQAPEHDPQKRKSCVWKVEEIVTVGPCV